MIKNNSELKETKNRLAQFKASLKTIQDKILDFHPVQLEMKINSLKSYIEEFENDIEEYENLKAGRIDSIAIPSIDALPEALIRSRIAMKLSQDELAKRIGTSQQQIYRWESTNYESASFSSLKSVVKALNIKFFCPNLIGDPIGFKNVLTPPFPSYSLNKCEQLVRERKILFLVGQN